MTAHKPRARQGEEAKPKRREEERRIDEEIEESFPASDPPSYAGGGAVGEPKRPERRRPA